MGILSGMFACLSGSVLIKIFETCEYKQDSYSAFTRLLILPLKPVTSSFVYFETEY